MSPPGARAGEPVVFGAEIANRGTGAAAPFSARLRIDGRSLPLVSVPGLAPGASTTVEFQAWTATLGTHRVRATADALKQIAEPNEHDNHLQRRFVVTRKARGLPDLVPVDLSLVPCDPREDQPVTFFARVHNRGGNALDAFVVRFDVDGVSLGRDRGGRPAGRQDASR